MLRPTRSCRMALAGLAALLLAPAAPAQGLLMDARRMAMGGVRAPRPGDLAADNPAYAAAAPGPAWPGSLPLPLGLLPLAADWPSFDPDSPDFDPLRLANLVANPPLHVELRRPDPLDGDLVIDLGQENLRVFWEDAHLVVPREPVALGGRSDRFGFGLGGPLGARAHWRAQVNPFVDLRLETAVDEALYGLLAAGDSLAPNARYTLTGEGAAAAGLAFSVRLGGRRGGTAGAPALSWGLRPKLLTGFAMAAGELDVALASGDSLFASKELEVEQRSLTRSGAGLGLGFALDLGLVLQRGPWDLGIGVRDLAGSIRFPDTRLEEQRLEDGADGNGGTVRRVLAEGESYRYVLDPLWTCHGGYAAGPWLWRAEWRLRPWGDSVHIGGERRLGLWALRAGSQRDAGGDWQAAIGGGRCFGGLCLDLALETHGRFIQDERGLALGLSLSHSL